MFDWLEGNPSVASLIGVFLGVVLGALFTYLLDWWRERRTRATQATYLARRVVIAIDKFVEAIASAFQEEEPSPGPEGPHPDYFALPNQFIEPVDVDWRTLAVDDMDKALRIAFRDDQIRRKIRAASQHSHDLAKEVWEDEFSRLALDAYGLAQGLRKKYSIADWRRGEEYDPLEAIQRVRDLVGARESRRAAALATDLAP